MYRVSVPVHLQAALKSIRAVPEITEYIGILCQLFLRFFYFACHIIFYNHYEVYGMYEKFNHEYSLHFSVSHPKSKKQTLFQGLFSR